MLMSHHGPSKPYQTVIRLWSEPGGCSVVPSSLRACAIIPAAVPMSRLHVDGKRSHVPGDHCLRILIHGALIRVDVEYPGSAKWIHRCGLADCHLFPLS